MSHPATAPTPALRRFYSAVAAAFDARACDARAPAAARRLAPTPPAPLPGPHPPLK